MPDDVLAYMHMKRTTVFFDEQIERELRAAARRENRPAASIVREAVEQYLVAHRPGRSKPGFIAIGDSGCTDTAERHEDLLWADDEAGLKPGARGTGSDATPSRRRQSRGKRLARAGSTKKP